MSDTKPRSKGTINGDALQLVPRHAGRIARIKEAIAKADARGDTLRVASLNEELSRRYEELEAAKVAIGNL